MGNSKHKYNSIDMPLRVFINAMVDHDYSEIENFEDVFIEYCQSVGGEELAQQMGNIKESNTLRLRISMAQDAIDLLKFEPLNDFQKKERDEIFEELKKLRYHLLIPACDLNDIKKYCSQIEGHVKLEAVRLSFLEAEQQPKKGKQKEAVYSRDYFVDMLNEMSAIFKIHINDSISLREYCGWIRKYKKEVERLNKIAA